MLGISSKMAIKCAASFGVTARTRASIPWGPGNLCPADWLMYNRDTTPPERTKGPHASMSTEHVSIDGAGLTLDQVRRVARQRAGVTLAGKARQRVERAAQRLAAKASSEAPIYGVNTGFGVFADRRIAPGQAAQLSTNLILSHAAGVGPPFSREVVRASMLIRANTLAAGHSGVRPVILETLLALLSAGVTPWVPSQGSLGSSGDLAPLAQLALVFTDHPDRAASSGQAWLGETLMPGAEAIRSAGIDPVRLEAKEGLALTNGATFSAAMLALAVLDAVELVLQAEIVAGMTLEALRGVSHAFDDRLHQSRNHPGQIESAARLRLLTAGSSLLDSGPQVQDAYSLRCIPQIHGPAHELLGFVAEIVEREINAATDNPLLYDDTVISGGNFHGEPIGLAADYLKLPLAEIGALAERRLFRLTSEHSSFGLPSMLVGSPGQEGLQSGLMMLQYTAASLVLENQGLASADSLRSLPTSAGQEDHNANATLAARNLVTILANVRQIVAIEWVAAGQALDLRLRHEPDLKLGPGSRAGLSLLRSSVAFAEQDRPSYPDLARAVEMLQSAELLPRAADACDGLIGPRYAAWLGML